LEEVIVRLPERGGAFDLEPAQVSNNSQPEAAGTCRKRRQGTVGGGIYPVRYDPDGVGKVQEQGLATKGEWQGPR